MRSNVMVRDLNTSIPTSDERQIEVVASGLPVFGGQQLAIDITVRSVVKRDGAARASTDRRDGVTADRARDDKEPKYPELLGSRCKLVVLAIELGGRFSTETGEFLRQLAAAKALTVPSYLRGSAAVAFERRWSRMLAMSVASSHAASILMDKGSLVQADHGASAQPWLQDLLTESQGCSLPAL